MGGRGAAHAGSSPWRLTHRRGDPGLLHRIGPAAGMGRFVRVCEVTRGAVVLGSTQPEGDVDATAAARAGFDVVRRRTGGGAVLVEAGALVWVDVGVAAGDPLWQADVGRAFWWLGEAWAVALQALGVAGASVHRGGLVTTSWSRRLCFAGLGPGEVTVEGRKVVGMAQRRNRHGALFQCAAPLRWDPDRLAGVLAVSPAERESAAEELRRAGTALPGVEASEVVGALVARLPRGGQGGGGGRWGSGD